MFLGRIQWIIDTIGKLGPLAVAIAVYLANRRQIKWTNRVSVRTADIEDQKLRLALLDRRLSVMVHLRDARDKLTPTYGGADALIGTMNALREAQLVFTDEDRKAISECLSQIIAFQNRYAVNFVDLRGNELSEAAVAYQACTGKITKVLDALSEASRIRTVEPLRS